MIGRMEPKVPEGPLQIGRLMRKIQTAAQTITKARSVPC